MRKFMEKDQGLIRRFQKIDIYEPSEEDTVKILEGLKEGFEKHHGVQYPSPVIKLAVKLSQKHIADRKLPDKAIDVIDEAGAYVQISESGKAVRKKTHVAPKDIEEIVALMARIPRKSVSSNEKDKLKNLEKSLKMVLFGQDEAVDSVVNAIQLSRSGLSTQGKPIASFLFAGPTGVGKTELAKQLSFNLGVHFERFDMSEYMEKHAVSKLIGAPPGYVGFDQGGKLTDAISKNPYCVLLLDEIEKAHKDIYNILLQVMDHGVLSDSTGKAVDFRNVILIMTTNAGSIEADSGSIGLAGGSELSINGRLGDHKRDSVLKNFFTPEFRNRLDGIIHFNKLMLSNIQMIVDKFLIELEISLKEKNVEMEVTVAAKHYLAEHGYDVKLGARPIGRLINDKIKRILSKEILFGELEKGGKVLIDWKDDNFHFSYQQK
jgi:ATP-dependent Clp protease ATP-binding subunit ClpA